MQDFREIPKQNQNVAVKVPAYWKPYIEEAMGIAGVPRKDWYWALGEDLLEAVVTSPYGETELGQMVEAVRTDPEITRQAFEESWRWTADLRDADGNYI